MQVAAGSGCAKAFVCRYHGWTYRLDGTLSHVPHEHGFPGLDRPSHGLVSVRVVERSGLVFVTQDGEGGDGETLEGLPELIAPQQKVFATSERQRRTA